MLSGLSQTHNVYLHIPVSALACPVFLECWLMGSASPSVPFKTWLPACSHRSSPGVSAWSVQLSWRETSSASLHIITGSLIFLSYVRVRPREQPVKNQLLGSGDVMQASGSRLICPSCQRHINPSIPGPRKPQLPAHTVPASLGLGSLDRRPELQDHRSSPSCRLPRS